MRRVGLTPADLSRIRTVLVCVETSDAHHAPCTMNRGPASPRLCMLRSKGALVHAMLLHPAACLMKAFDWSGRRNELPGATRRSCPAAPRHLPAPQLRPALCPCTCRCAA